jgi:hypothetical protein
MDADKIYLATVHNLATAIGSHKCPNGRTSLAAFCECYSFNRPNLCQILLGTGHDMSIGLYLRILVALGQAEPTCLPPTNTTATTDISLRHYLRIDYTLVARSIVNLAYS